MKIRIKVLYLFLIIALIIPFSSISISESVADSKSENSGRTSNILTANSNITQKAEYIAINAETSEYKMSSTEKDSNQKIAYITIDDGPSRNNTPKNLDTLKKYGVKATFFVLPRSNLDDIYKRIVDEGHVIGNHSYSHNYSSLYSSTDKFRKDILKAKNYISEKLNYTSTVFRFPGGSMGRKKNMIKERADILTKLGYTYFDWNITTADTDPNLKKYGTEEFIVNLLANNVIKNTKDRKQLIILMHDSSDKIYTPKALPKIIEGLKKQGYKFDVLTNYK